MKEKWKIKFKNRKFRVRFLLAALLLLALLSAAVYTVFIKPNLSAETFVYKEETVHRGDLVLGIMESGSVSLAETSFDYTLELEDDDDEEEDDNDNDDGEDDEESIKYPEIEEVYVASGQRIKQGDALFKLTGESVKAVKKRLNSLYTEAQIALSEAETQYKTELLTAQSAYDTSRLSAERAESSRLASSTQTGESVNRLLADIKVLEEEIAWYEEQLADEELFSDLEEAQTAYTQALNRYEATDIHNATAYAANYSSYKSAKAQVDSIEDQMDAWREIIEDNRESIAKKRQELADAQALLEAENLENESSYDLAVLGGELAEGIYRYTVDSLEETVSAAQADLKEAEEQLEEFTVFAGEDGTVYADGSGLVTGVVYEAGDDLLTAGAMLSYVKEDAYAVSIDVSEEDISAIRVGDSVDVVMTAYPATVYKGTVTSITTTVSSEYAATVSYPVEIRIEGDTSLLYGGMTAAVTFVTDSVTDVLYVSRKAIQSVNGKSYVYMDGKAGGKKLVEVETGFSDGTGIEIINGLSEGDTVYIQSRVSGDAADLTRSAATKEVQAGESGQEATPAGEPGLEGTQAQERGLPAGAMPEGIPTEGTMPAGVPTDEHEP